MTAKRGIQKNKKITPRYILKKKLNVMGFFVLLAFIVLSVRLYLIARDNHDRYQKKILSQQRYDSSTLPFKRGSITDKNGTILAISERVYNVILDCKVMLGKPENQAPTVNALAECFGFDAAEINAYVASNPTSRYRVLKKHLTYDEISPFIEKQKEYNKMVAGDSTKKGIIEGVWFEDEYIREYPNNALACDVIGFTRSDNNGTFGLEEYYNNALNGTNGRVYGYLNDDATLERTTIPAVDGNNLVTTLDANIQAICEKYLIQFNEEHKDEFEPGLGALNMGAIVMNPKTGEVLAMASFPNYDLNNPKDLSAYYTEEEITTMKEEDKYYDTLNSLWRNFCISDSYEPGSTAKTITMAAGLETGKILGNETYECNGSLEVGGHTIRCNLRRGHGILDVSGALEQSCNVALMKMGAAIGASDMLKFQNIFNIGLKTNIDLVGEARTAGLVYNESNMHDAEVATSSFGQGFNVTMIEMAAAYCSIINGGNYYEPHVVSKITNSSGETVKNIEPRVLKKTISASTSERMISYLNAAVAEGTGKSARPAGYAIGGKTGTAEKGARNKEHYVVSFIGHAPSVDPEIVIYVVVDDPNVKDKAHATYATGIVRNILTEVLPYLHIGMTEEVTIGEQEEIEQILGNLAKPGQNYVVNPLTGELVNPETGEIAEPNNTYEGDGDVANQ